MEGGSSLTLGTEYSLTNNEEQKFINLSFANVLRLKENPDLPKIYGFSEKRSDFIGEFNIIPSKFFDLNYQFSLDKNLNNSNYDLVKANININNFVTSFEYLNQNNYEDKESYLINKTEYSLNNSNSLLFSTRKNKKTDLTEYYNFIYQYKNDCLAASIEYNKDYYSDRDIKPEETIFLKLTIIPFGETRTVIPGYND